MSSNFQVVAQFTEDALAPEDQPCGHTQSCGKMIRKGEPRFYVASADSNRPGRFVCSQCFKRDIDIAATKSKFTQNRGADVASATTSQEAMDTLASIRRAVSAAQRKSTTNPPKVMAMSPVMAASSVAGPSIRMGHSHATQAVQSYAGPVLLPSSAPQGPGYGPQHAAWPAARQYWANQAYSRPQSALSLVSPPPLHHLLAHTTSYPIETITLNISAQHEGGSNRKSRSHGTPFGSILEGKRDVDARIKAPDVIILALGLVVPRIKAFDSRFPWREEEFVVRDADWVDLAKCEAGEEFFYRRCLVAPPVGSVARKSKSKGPAGLTFKSKTFALHVVVPSKQWSEYEAFLDQDSASHNTLATSPDPIRDSRIQRIPTAEQSRRTTADTRIQHIPTAAPQSRRTTADTRIQRIPTADHTTADTRIQHIPTAEPQSCHTTADTHIQRIPTAEQSRRTAKDPTQQWKPLEVARTRANKALSGPNSLFLTAPSTATGSRHDPISLSSSDESQPIAITSKRSHVHSSSVSSMTTKSPPSKRAVHDTTISVDRNRLRDALRSGGDASLNVIDVMKVKRDMVEFYPIPTFSIYDILDDPEKRSFNINAKWAKLFPGQMRFDGTPSGVVGVGGFKTSQRAQLMLNMVRPDGIGSQSCQDIVVKRFYVRNDALLKGINENNGKMRFDRFTTADELEMLYREANILYWAKSLFQLTYDFIDRAVGKAITPPPFPIPRLRFVDAGLLLAVKPGNNNVKTQSATNVHTSYLAEELISTDEPFVKYIHNSEPVPLPERGEPGYDIAQFLVFTQHVQYVKTNGSAYITDYQGSGSLLTDPQILTHPSVGDGIELFGEGNLEVGVQRFAQEHICNEFCKWRGFNLALPESIVLDI